MYSLTCFVLLSPHRRISLPLGEWEGGSGSEGSGGGGAGGGEEFSTGLRKSTHKSDTSPIRVTPGDFDALISNSFEKGYLERWLSAMEKQCLFLVMKGGPHEILPAVLFLNVFYSQS